MNEYIIKVEKQNEKPLAGFGSDLTLKYKQQTGTLPLSLVNINHNGALATISADVDGTSKDNPILVSGTMFSFFAAPVDMQLEYMSELETVRMTIEPGVNTVVLPNIYVTLPDELVQQQYGGIPQTYDNTMQYYME